MIVCLLGDHRSKLELPRRASCSEMCSVLKLEGPLKFWWVGVHMAWHVTKRALASAICHTNAIAVGPDHYSFEHTNKAASLDTYVPPRNPKSSRISSQGILHTSKSPSSNDPRHLNPRPHELQIHSTLAALIKTSHPLSGCYTH